MTSFNEVQNLISVGEFSQALKLLGSTNPKNAQEKIVSLNLTAFIYQKLRDNDSLLTTLEALIKLDKNNLDALLAVCELYSTNDLSKSMLWYDKLAKKLKELNEVSFFKKNFARFDLALKKSKQHLSLQLKSLKLAPSNDRFQLFADIIFNSKSCKADIPNNLQRPTFLYYPDIESKPWHSTKDYIPQVKDIDSIVKETLTILQGNNSSPYFEFERQSNTPLETLRNNPSWSSINLSNENKVLDEKEHPVLTQYIKSLPLAECEPHAPEVILSILKPNTHIPPHYGLSNFKLTLHLPIIVPKGNLSIKAGKETKLWEQGKPLLFDDSYIHEATNYSKETRVVLITDIWHPDLSEDERTLISEAIPVIDSWQKRPFNALFHHGLNY